MNNQIICDTTTMMMVKLLRETIAEEPPEANENMPVGLAEETARRHEEWSRHLYATRLMLSMRLLGLAQEQLP